MISFPANIDIFVVHTPVSFACGIDGMCRYCQLILQKDPISKCYFIFINRLKTQVRILWFDGQGFSLCNKRLSSGNFKNWPVTPEKIFSNIEFYDAQCLISCCDIKENKKIKLWKKIS